MKLTAVVAASDNDVIGSNNALPWHQPADLAHFKRITMGKPVLMGRRTWESIGKPLPGRLNLVMTRSALDRPGVERVASLDEACLRAAPAEEMMVIGGAGVFALAMSQLDVIQLTRVHCTVNGDTFMPTLQPEQWREVSREYRAADDRNVYAMTFIELRRIAAAAAG
jgi:dihydrofolate reductase